MSKKKKKQTQPLSAQQFILTRARQLELGPCYISSDYETHPQKFIVITRRHKQGNLTAGFYLVDTGARGVMDSWHVFNVSKDDFEERLRATKDGWYWKMIEVPYELVHNYIYGSLEWAEEAGFQPCSSFTIDRNILEEDTENIPLIELEFGIDGKHFAVYKNDSEAERLNSIMSKHLEPGTFVCIKGSDKDFEEEYDDDDDDDDDDDFLNDKERAFDKIDNLSDSEVMKLANDLKETCNNLQKELLEAAMESGADNTRFVIKMFLELQEFCERERLSYPPLPYSINDNYDYPSELKLSKTLQQVFIDSYDSMEDVESMPPTYKANILRMKRENLMQQLQQVLLYAMGEFKKNGEINEIQNLPIALELLCTLPEGDIEKKRETILQLLKQPEEFIDDYIVYDFYETLPTWCAPLFNEKLDTFTEICHSKEYSEKRIPFIMGCVEQMEKENLISRKDAIDWYGNLLDFWYEHWNEHCYCSANDISHIFCSLMNLHASELTDKVKKFFALDKAVNVNICGQEEYVLSELKSAKK